MEKLYTELAEVYEAMYRTLMDYDGEYACYAPLLRRYGAHKILEIGCGAGNLAERLLDGGFDYAGMDISPDMLNIARRQFCNRYFNGHIKGKFRSNIKRYHAFFGRNIKG